MKPSAFLAAALALTASPCPGQEAAAPRMGLVDEKVGALVASGDIAGAVVMVAKDGETLHLGAYGVRDTTTGAAMTEDTIFRIYSMTKPVTSTAIMMLVEDGKIGLDDPVSKHLPALASPTVLVEQGEEVPAGREPTVRDLLRHTGGYSYGFIGGPVAARYNEVDLLARDSSLDAMVEKLAGIPLAYQPGERWVYSISIDLLGAIVQAAAGRPFEEFLEERIFAPLKMGDTAFYVPAAKRARFASTHGRGPGGKLLVSESAVGSPYLEPPSLPSGGGGLCSTARDYMRFCQMILNGGELEGARILKPESVAQMARDQLPEGIDHIAIGGERPGVGFGLGFNVRTAEKEWGFGGKVGEIGWGGAASTHFWMLPEEGIAVVTLRNFMPYQWTLEEALKRPLYEALLEK